MMAIRLLLIAVLLSPAMGYAESPPPENPTERLLREKSSALVNIRYLLKVNSRFGETELERDITAVMIEADGLVLCADSQLTGSQPWGRGEANLPTNIRVLIDDDTEGLPARIIARDSELDLAWLRIRSPDGRTFTTIDLTKSAKVRPGDALHMVTRLDKYYDRAPIVRTTHVGGMMNKPRRAYVPNMSLSGLGLPVFTDSGDVVGVAIALMPDREAIESGTVDWRSGFGVVLPAEDVLRSTQRAKEADETPADQPAP